MPGGTCDPASRGLDHDEFVQMKGPVTVYGEYGWDGVSVRPDCNGPVSLLRATNTSTEDTWYAHFQGRNLSWSTLTLLPETVREITDPVELEQLGMANSADLEGLNISQSPTPPQIVTGRVKK